MTTLSDAVAALDMFYPVHEGRRYWGGYARFFEPALPSRIGSVLINAIREAIGGDNDLRWDAIAILSQTHTKTVNHVKGVPPQEVVCYPTEDAKTAIKLLRAL